MADPSTQGAPFTYRDYLGWDPERRFELIEGEALAMSPAPDLDHQEISAELLVQLRLALRDSPCRAFAAPFDVRLAEADEADEDVRTVVQPDLLVVCDAAKLDRRGCRGAPDWVIEILSPASAAHDQIRKRQLYERHGVREYWLIHPTDRLVTVYLADAEGTCGRPEIRETAGILASAVLPKVEIEWASIFARVGSDDTR